MLYENKEYKKVKNARLMLVTCGVCKEELALYHKVGRGNLLKMHLNRIIESNSKLENELKCFKCSGLIGHKIYLKRRKKQVYKMIKGKYNTKFI